MIIEVLDKKEFYLLCEIRELRNKLGFHSSIAKRHLTDLRAERDRLKRLVRVCYGD